MKCRDCGHSVGIVYEGGKPIEYYCAYCNVIKKMTGYDLSELEDKDTEDIPCSR